MKKVSVVVIHAHGEPSESVRVEGRELGDPAPHEALVELEAAPINPADLNVIEGKYPIRPELPGVPGVEGAGIVRAIGAEVTNVKPGDLVLLPHFLGTWREACIVAADQLVVVPADIPAVQAAMLKINPATAWRMLHDFIDLRAGDWIIQNAANSAVGRAVIQIAKTLGVKTVSVVRREELIDELLAEGGDAVLIDGDDLKKQTAAATGDAPIRLALNAVGGESALRLAGPLAFGGTTVTYGAMSRQPLRIPTGLLIFKDLRWRGFWVTHWYQEATVAARDAMFAALFPLAQRGLLRAPVEKIYPVKEAIAAIRHAQQEKRSGKILLGNRV